MRVSQAAMRKDAPSTGDRDEQKVDDAKYKQDVADVGMPRAEVTEVVVPNRTVDLEADVASHPACKTEDADEHAPRSA